MLLLLFTGVKRRRRAGGAGPIPARQPNVYDKDVQAANARIVALVTAFLNTHLK